MSSTLVVVGAGAAGLMAALTAARAGRDVRLLEGTPDGGRKILISGGGRCNILPSCAALDRFVTDSSPNTLRKILRSWPLKEQRAFFERELHMPLVLEKETGKLFPESNRARDVRDGLMTRVREAGGRIDYGARAKTIEAAGDRWVVRLAGGEGIESTQVIVATGGLSVPSTGSDGAGLAMMRKIGHEVVEPYPALTPLTAEPHRHRDLAGVSAPVELAAGRRGGRPARAKGPLLVTHRGWSGPVVLDLSHVATRAQAYEESADILVTWAAIGAKELEGRLLSSEAPAGATVRSALGAASPELPRRLGEALAAEAGVPPETPLARLSREDRRALVEVLTGYRLPWTGHEGYRKAEVTGGGVALGEIDPRTMESRRAPGLFLCGEILDAFGPIGGHNFQWAWATGRAAGLGAAART